ncbi:TrmH family RNA methyltransferase [Desulfobacula sp.]|jgi:tRNA G18 (ribose-2'-O)-methylase SpoU|uniref:TrmH family RNA methyltransferase n=1 Tax=Desulfobacula sp. TaxID=2593537 RepID=UPI0039B85F7D
MSQFEHQRHKNCANLTRDREIIVACAPMRSNVNISTIARTASACAIEKLVLTGNASLISKIARDGAEKLEVSVHRTLKPVLLKLRKEGYRLVGLEQATNSVSMHDYAFLRRTALVIGNERTGLTPDVLEVLDDVVEIPVYGLPHSFNAATATSMTLYEYCKQYPQG